MKLLEQHMQTSEERMKQIRPKKREKGQIIWTGDDLSSMSELEREMIETVAKKTFFDYIDPFNLFDLNKKAEDFNKELQKGFEETRVSIC